MTEISFGQILSAHAASNPDQVVITHNDEVWTASAFHRWTNRLARIYIEHGVGRNDMVTIALPNGAEFFAACFAAWKDYFTGECRTGRGNRGRVTQWCTCSADRLSTRE